MTAKKARGLAVDTLYYIAGSFLYATAVHVFALHAGFVPGGVSGVSMLLNHFFRVPIGVTTLVLNIPLALVSMRVIGRRFIGKSVYTMAINAVMLDLVFPHLPSYTGNPLLAAMFTGVFMGAGLALIYMRGSSTGGSDFAVMSIRKRRPSLSVGQINVVFDAVVIVAGGVAYGSVDAVLYGIIASFASSITLDRVLYGAGSSKMVIIITDKGQEIAESIGRVVNRGSTLLAGLGTYTGTPRDVLLCACSKSEVYRVRSLARSLDGHALMMVADASEVVGEGFVPPPVPGNEGA